MRKLSVLMIVLMFLSGCATYKFQKGRSPYDKGYVVSRDGRAIVEYTLGKDDTVPDGLNFAKQRFKRRKGVVEHYYKKMGYVENRFKESFWDPVVLFIKFVPSVFRLPFVAMSDYKYEHDPEYREKLKKLVEAQEIAERERISKLKADLNKYIQDDLAKEPSF